MTTISTFKRQLIGTFFAIFCTLYLFSSGTKNLRMRRSISDGISGEIESSSSSWITSPRNCSNISKSFCEEDDDGCLPLSVTKNWQLMVHAKEYKLSHCVILKDLSTIMMAIFCYLNNPERFSAENRTITTEFWKIRGCKGVNEWTKIRSTLMKNESWQHLAVIREPIERFLSGWVDKCYNKYAKYGNYRGYCYNCGQNLTCFIEKFYFKIKTFKTEKVFRNFAMENHFWPQSWYCNFTHHLNDYTMLKYDTHSKGEFYVELANILELRNVPQRDIDEIFRQGMSNSTSHTVSGKSVLERFRKALYSDKRLMKLLIRVFYNDYKMFGYPIPCF